MIKILNKDMSTLPIEYHYKTRVDFVAIHSLNKNQKRKLWYFLGNSDFFYEKPIIDETEHDIPEDIIVYPDISTIFSTLDINP